MGWFGFNAGSQLRFAEAADAVRASAILINTNLSASCGLVSAFLISKLVLRRVDLLGVLNGAIAGLVAIAAGPDLPDHRLALLVGAGAGVVSMLGMLVLERLRIDDVVGAVPAHLAGGIWGSLIVCVTSGGSPGIQLIGVVSVGVFVFLASMAVWMLLELTFGARVSWEVEAAGQDAAELKMSAYPDFAPVTPPGEPDNAERGAGRDVR